MSALRSLIFIIWMVGWSLGVAAQSIVGSSGGNSQIGQYAITYSVGEPAVITSTENNWAITQGYCQPYSGTTSISQPNEWSIEIAPNPVNSGLIYLASANIVSIHAELIDLYGHIVKSWNEAVSPLDVHSIPAGIYSLRVRRSDHSNYKTFKVVII